MDSVKTLNYSAFVKTLEEQMGFYAAYHRDARNKATHFVGVPGIMLALLVPLSLLRVEVAGFEVTAAMLLAAAVLAYYFILDVPLALAMLAVIGGLIWLAEAIASLGPGPGWAWFGALFALGWTLQLLGHVFEGRRPALADNLFQVFVAPIFLAAEAAFALGWRKDLQAKVLQLSRAHSADSSISRARTS
jgi:uncharacterized membrane protein YGL010W